MNCPRLSIGLPVRNGARFLAETLDSLLGQTFGDFELLIADNASTDATQEIASAYAARDSRIRYHRHAENVGGARNFNFCFEQTRGELFKWSASDDRLHPTFLQRCVAVLEERPEVVLCAADAVEIDSEGTLGARYDYDMATDDPRASVRFRDLILVRHPCTLVFGVARRDSLATTRLIGGFVSADRVLLAELGLRGRLVSIPEPLFERRVHEENSIFLDKRGSLLAWFDPSRSGAVSLPTWRLVGELLRSVKAAPISAREKLRCAGAIATHAHRRRSELLLDLRVASRRWLGRLPLVRDSVTQLRGPSAHAD